MQQSTSVSVSSSSRTAARPLSGAAHRSACDRELLIAQVTAKGTDPAAPKCPLCADPMIRGERRLTPRTAVKSWVCDHCKTWTPLVTKISANPVTATASTTATAAAAEEAR